MEAPVAKSPSTTTALWRRHSTGTPPRVPSKIILPTNTKSSSFPTSFPTINLDLVSLDSSASSNSYYTSLRDLLPSPVLNSPTTNSSDMISIRNRLVKQAAWAYLQPMAASPESCRRFGFFANPINSFFCFLRNRFFPAVSRVLDRILRAVRLRTRHSC